MTCFIGSFVMMETLTLITQILFSSAISLIMFAYTNRSFAYASVVRVIY